MNSSKPRDVIEAIRADIGSGYAISKELLAILETKHKASARYQKSNGVDFQLTFDEYLAVIGPWRMGQMEKKLKAGEFRRFMDGAFGYVLTWKDKACKDAKVMNADTCMFVNREAAKRALQLKKGDKQTEAGKAKIAAARRGTKASDEARAAMSAAHTGKRQSADHNAAISKGKTGRKMSDAQKAAIAAGQARRHAERRAAQGASNG